VIKTLHLYLSRELMKVTALALVAFTLVMTVFAIIEPLRKEGLASNQVAALFGYTVPIMVSLTFPIAALFAATIVYGRFAQDNEMMACRASGISTLVLLGPALALGGIVTVTTLALSNFVSPKMASLAELAVKANVRGIAYRRLRTRNYVKWGRYVVHADHVDPDQDMLRGVVAADTGKSGDVRLLAASTAYAYFSTREGETFVTISLINPVGGQTGTNSPTIAQEASQPLEWGPLPNPAREDPSWYNWGKLLRARRHPTENAGIRHELKKIRRRICHNMLAQEVAEAINAGNSYDHLRDQQKQYVIRAAGAQLDSPEAVMLFSDTANEASPQRVSVTILRNGKPRQSIHADAGRVETSTSWSPTAGTSLVTIKLRGGVSVRQIEPEGEHQQRRSGWTVGQLGVPEHIVRKTEAIGLEDIIMQPGKFTSNRKIHENIESLVTSEVKRLTNRITAEMHVRIAYGLSCLLLVAMGAALGLIFRGGQIVSAFAICVIPAAMTIVMIIMGKEMIRNRDVPTIFGLAAIWGGIAALLLADICVYVHLMRR